jgi:hypothetical protein
VSASGIGARQCAALFGDAVARRTNAASRARNLDWVDEEPTGVTIAHAAEGWDEPAAIQLRGIRLVRTRAAGIAEVQLSPEAARAAGCVAGTYVVGMDSSLGLQARVLAVMRHGVLVERRGRLAFITAPGMEHPRWLLAWRMRATLQPPAPGSGGEEVMIGRSHYRRYSGGD